MLWFTRYAEVQTVSKQRALQMAGPMPKIPEGYDLFLDIFFRLNSERHNSDGIIGSIPVTKIIEYGTWLGIDRINDLIEVISIMDKEYVDARSQQIRKQMQTSKG